ncbi:MAG: gluconokinase [Fibrobacterota bacterium]
MIYLMSGPAGAGKSTLGKMLSHTLSLPFVEGDNWHPRKNIRKMSAGIPLTDEDRRPWLEALVRKLHTCTAAGAVCTCSALKRRYRTYLHRELPGLTILFLTLSRAEATRRLAQRSHFFDPSLIDSQFDTLEPPLPAENVLTYTADTTPEVLLTRILKGINHDL